MASPPLYGLAQFRVERFADGTVGLKTQIDAYLALGHNDDVRLAANVNGAWEAWEMERSGQSFALKNGKQRYLRVERDGSNCSTDRRADREIFTSEEKNGAIQLKRSNGEYLQVPLFCMTPPPRMGECDWRAKHFDIDDGFTSLCWVIYENKMYYTLECTNAQGETHVDMLARLTNRKVSPGQAACDREIWGGSVKSEGSLHLNSFLNHEGFGLQTKDLYEEWNKINADIDELWNGENRRKYGLAKQAYYTAVDDEEKKQKDVHKLRQEILKLSSDKKDRKMSDDVANRYKDLIMNTNEWVRIFVGEYTNTWPV